MGILHRKRLWALACVFACIIAGVPYWWKATEISRPPLPHDEIARVAAAHAAQIPRHRLHVELVVVQGGGGRLDSSSAEDAALLLEDATCAAMESSGFSSGAVCQEEVELEVKVVSTAEECADVGLHCEGLAREACAGELESAVEAIPWAYVESSPMRFRILAVLCSAPPGSRSSAVLVSAGRLGLAVVTGTAASAAVQRRVASAAAATAAAVFAGDTVRRFRAMRHGTSGNPAWGGMPISAAGQVALSFSLCNGDVAGGGVVLWDFQRWHSRYLQPMLEELAPITNVTVDSQVLFQTPSRERGAWSEQHRAFVLKQQQLPFFLDNDWPLDSGRALSSPSAAQHEDSSAAAAAAAIPSPVLHWVVYVPAPAQQPLRIQGADASRLLPSDAFEIPAWGGVILLNLDPLANQTDRRYRPRQLLVPEADAARVMQVVRAQLRSLNGLPESSEQYRDHLGATHLPLYGTDLDVHVKFQDPGRSGRLLAGWELDALLRERAACNLASAVASLSSLSQVVQDLANLAIPDAVGSYVDEALSKIQAAQAALAASQLLQAAALAQEAAALAELAFSHSSILAQLNVPDVQKLAVYMPFFVPAALPLLRHLLRELALLRSTLPSRSRP